MRAQELGAFDRPVILAEHPAQWRYLALELAKAQGCFASMRILTPEGWLDEVLQLEGAEREWRPRAMSFQLAAAIEASAHKLPASAQRIVDTGDRVALHEFAQQIAQRFRDYLHHRPELLMAWERGVRRYEDSEGTEDWQALLWRELVLRTATKSPAARVEAVLEGEFTLAADVPAVIHIITDTRVPPTVAAMLNMIGEQRDVHWCVVDWPCALAPAPVGTLLNAVQQSILRDEQVAATDDGSLSIHACHSPWREVETLRELAVQALAGDATLRPEDITLYVSDVSSYASAVEAVFDVPQPGLPQIPYSIAGRPYREASPVARTVMQLVEAADGRMTLDEIGGLLRLDPIARAARFTDEDTATALNLATQAGITWGASAAERGDRYALPSLAAGTWQRGIDRLVLGVATGPSTEAVDELLPVSGAMAGHAELIGRLAEWSERLFEAFAAMRSVRLPTEWSALMERLLRDFVQASNADDDNALRAVREAMRSQLDAIAATTPTAELRLETMRAMLARTLEDRGAKAGHLRGGMRVCRLEPGTVLPSRVVVMAGFDDALHPGGGGSLAWDLLLREKLPTDPDRRVELLNVFREAVCSASQAVHVAYTALTMTKHEERAPSVAVAELQERALRALEESERATFLRNEPAHPFSPALFAAESPRQLQSAASAWAAAARRIVEADGEDPVFGATPVPDDATTNISMESLAACVSDPTRFFCGHVLGLRLYEDDDALADSEPQGIPPFTKDGVSNEFRTVSWRAEEAARRGAITSAKSLHAWLKHQPELAYGAEGEEVSAALAQSWWGALERWRDLEWAPVRPVEVRVGRYTIIGRLDRLTPDSRTIASLYDVSEATGLKQWVQHLMLNVLAARGDTLPVQTAFIGIAPWQLRPVADAERVLEDLCDFYIEARQQPQPLYRKSGIAYLLKLGMQPPEAADDFTREKALEEAAKEWIGESHDDGRSGESEQEWQRLCWGSVHFLNDETQLALMQRVSVRVLLPFLTASTVKRKGKPE